MEQQTKYIRVYASNTTSIESNDTDKAFANNHRRRDEAGKYKLLNTSNEPFTDDKPDSYYKDNNDCGDENNIGLQKPKRKEEK